MTFELKTKFKKYKKILNEVALNCDMHYCDVPIWGFLTFTHVGKCFFFFNHVSYCLYFSCSRAKLAQYFFNFDVLRTV